MYAKFKTNLTGMAVALGFVLVGYALGEPPRAGQAPADPASLIAQSDDATAGQARRGALKRQLGMPYVSIASLLPRRES